MTDSCTTDIHFMAVDQLGQRYRRYRLPDPDAEAAMAASLGRYGQQTPVVVCLREERYEVLDGFKRLAAAQTLGLLTISTRLVEVDERLAKATILGLNQTGRRTQDWEEAWIVHALVREDGLTQEEVAELLSHHKSWVCRRLALVEKLADPARNDLRLGLLSVTAARSLVRLPAGNQAGLLTTFRRDKLTAAELDGVVNLLQAAPGQAPRRVHPRPAASGFATSTGGDWLGVGPPVEPIGQPRGATSDLCVGGSGSHRNLASQSRPRWFDALRSVGADAGILRVDSRCHQRSCLGPRPDRGVEHS